MSPEDLSTYAAWHGSLPQVRDVDVLPGFPDDFRRFVVMDGFRSLVPALPSTGAPLGDLLSVVFRRRAVLRRFGDWVDSRQFVDACLGALLRWPLAPIDADWKLDWALVLLTRAASAARTSDLGILVTVMSYRVHPLPALSPSPTWSVRRTRTHEAERAVVDALGQTLVDDTARSAVLYRAVLVLFWADPPLRWHNTIGQLERLELLRSAAELMLHGRDPWIGVRLYGSMCASPFGQRDGVPNEMLESLFKLIKQVKLPPPNSSHPAGEMICFAGKLVREASAHAADDRVITANRLAPGRAARRTATASTFWQSECAFVARSTANPPRKNRQSECAFVAGSTENPQ